jgi:outer membrane beta-barrel protein
MKTQSLLMAVILGVALHGGHAMAADAAPPAGEQVIEPDIERREIVVPKIDTEDFEVGIFAGTLSVEDFGANAVFGGRFAYHVTEDWFVELQGGVSTVADTTYRNLGAPQFPNEEEDLTFYNLSAGLNIFPGELFITTKRALSAAVYIIGGVGSTDFLNDAKQRESKFTFNFGIGIRLLPTDWMALGITMRDHLWESDLLGENKITNNFELSGTATVFF